MLKARQQAGKNAPAAPRDTPEPPRIGPCEERALPLARHAPRVLKTRREQRHPPKWTPTAEFRVRKSAADADAASGSGGGGGLPLAFFSPNVIEQVVGSVPPEDRRSAALSTPGNRAWRSADPGWLGDEAEPLDCEEDEEAVDVNDGFGGLAGGLRAFRVTDGGWAADLSDKLGPAAGAAAAERAAKAVHVSYVPPAEDYPDPDAADPSWPLDRECATWREKVEAHRRHAKLDRSVLANVDEFIGGDVARMFLS